MLPKPLELDFSNRLVRLIVASLKPKLLLDTSSDITFLYLGSSTALKERKASKNKYILNV